MKKTHIIALILIAISVGVIVSMVGEYGRYQTFATALAGDGGEFHIVGQLSTEDELYYNPLEDANYFSFFMFDKDGEKRKVIFRGTKPQDFERSEQIVLTGKMEGEDFHASKILMKCPSKYVDDNLEVIEVKASS